MYSNEYLVGTSCKVEGSLNMSLRLLIFLVTKVCPFDKVDPNQRRIWTCSWPFFEVVGYRGVSQPLDDPQPFFLYKP